VPLSLLLGLVIHLSAACVFAVLATVLNRRRVPAAARAANTMFALWWYCVGLQQLINAARIALWAGDFPLSLHVGLTLIGGAAIVTGLAGLLSYLIFMFTGRSVLRWPLVVFYSLYFGWYMTLVSGFNPIAVTPATWNVTYVYAAPPSQELVLSFLGVLVGPQLLAGIALVILGLRLPASAARVRALVVATGVLLWFGSTLLGPAAGFASGAWQLLTLLIPLTFGSSVLLVHRPPAWLRRRLPPELEGATARGAAGA
jgi:hypothetical protein